MSRLPRDLLAAIAAGDVTIDQVRELFRLEAEALGMSFDEALSAAREGHLPNNPVGADLDLLADLLTPA
jgi:hypothetical protein